MAREEKEERRRNQVVFERDENEKERRIMKLEEKVEEKKETSLTEEKEKSRESSSFPLEGRLVRRAQRQSKLILIASLSS